MKRTLAKKKLHSLLKEYAKMKADLATKWQQTAEQNMK